MEDENNELIVKFLDNDLTGEETIEFKNRIEKDTQFRQEVEKYAKVYISLNAMARKSLDMAGVSGKDQKKKSSRASLSVAYRAVAIFIPALIIINIFFYLIFKPSPSNDQLFSMFMKDTPVGTGRHALTGAGTELIEGGLEDINLAIMETIDQLNDPETLLLFGKVCMKKCRYYEAVSAYKRILTCPMADKSIVEEAQWYLCLCYLKTGDRVQAHSAIQTIIQNPDHLFYKEGKALHKKMK